ncbi:MAG: hypothetical protein ABI589_11415 [Burkholderiales bacterium]
MTARDMAGRAVAEKDRAEKNTAEQDATEKETAADEVTEKGAAEERDALEPANAADIAPVSEKPEVPATLLDVRSTPTARTQNEAAAQPTQNSGSDRSAPE